MEEQKKVKICFVATYTYALFNRNQENLPVTGLDVQLYNWAIELAKDPRYEIHFLVGDFGQSEKMVIDNVTLWKSSKPKKRGVFNGLVSFIILINILRKIFADIYVDRGASGPISFEVGIFSILSRKKILWFY